MSYLGKFIVVEGPDCSGKTSVAKELAKRLETKGYTVKLLLSHHDGEDNLAFKQRQLILDERLGAKMSDTTRALCFAAARRDMVENTILPALEDGQVVIADRWVLSTLAIQRDCQDLDNLMKIATGGLIPDNTFVLDLPATETLKRLAGRTEQQDILDKVSVSEHEARLVVYQSADKENDAYVRYLNTDIHDRDWAVSFFSSFLHTVQDLSEAIFCSFMDDQPQISPF